METNKIISLRYQLVIGYVLLAVGLLLIVWTIYQSYNIFTAKVSAPLIFRTQAAAKTSESATGGNLQELLQQQMQQELQKQIGQLLPADTIPKILNLASWSILAGILIFAGGTVAGIGIKMVK